LQLAYTRQDVNQVFYPYLLMDGVYDDADRLSVRYDTQELSDKLTGLTAQGYFTQVTHWMTDELRTSSARGSRDYSMGTMADTQTTGGKVEAEFGNVTFGSEVFERFWGAATEMAGMNYRAQYSLPDVRLRTFGFYAEYESPLNERLSLTAGARYDRVRSYADENKANTNLYFAYNGNRSTSTVDSFPSGKVGVIFSILPGMGLSAAVGHTVQVPEPTERYFALKRMGADWVGNPELTPSRNTGLDTAITFERSGYYIGANFFANRVKDFVALHDQPRINQVGGVINQKARSYTNVDATIWGSELDMVVSLTDLLFLSGDLSYVRGTKQAVPEEDIFSENLAEIPPLRFRLNLRFDDGRWFGAVEGMFAGAQKNVDTDLNEEETPGYGILNLHLGTRRGGLSFTFGIGNLFDRAYREHLSYQRDPFRSGARVPEPGRNFFVNVAFRK
jgi:iron complex outermembrane receptor protein